MATEGEFENSVTDQILYLGEVIKICGKFIVFEYNNK